MGHLFNLLIEEQMRLYCLYGRMMSLRFLGAKMNFTRDKWFRRQAFRARKGPHTSAGIDSGEAGGLLSCENGRFVLAGMLRGYGAYATD